MSWTVGSSFCVCSTEVWNERHVPHLAILRSNNNLGLARLQLTYLPTSSSNPLVKFAYPVDNPKMYTRRLT